MRVIATNRKARHIYEILETFEAGLVLTGSEVKALRENQCALADGYARFMNNELYLDKVQIGHYSHAGHSSHAQVRERKLLLNRRELRKLQKATQVKGQTLIPLKIYFKDSWAKVQLAVCRGKQKHDKRQDIADRDSKRQLDRVRKEMNRA